jgi:ATP-dependent 26S proteasome regulatory subunit
LGLTEVEIRHALDLSLAQRTGIGLAPEILREQLLQTKREAVMKSGLLEFEIPTIGLGAVGGLHPDILPALVSAVQPALDSLGFVPIPKGWLLVGVPGSGKSLVARAIAGELRLPLLRLDLGRLFSGFLGDTESNTYHVIEICEQLSPLVLWIDEFEKGFAGQQSTGGGTAGRMWAIFLNWLQERQAPVLMVATANQLQDLPGEIFRVGRFDAILFFDTPGKAERENIWEILLGKFGLKSLFSRSDLNDLATLSEGATGAEVEQALLSALYDQMAAPDRDFGELLRGRLKATKPLWRENTAQGSRDNQDLRVRADNVGAGPVNGWYREPLPPDPRLR